MNHAFGIRKNKEKMLKKLKKTVDFLGYVCYDVIGKESRVSTLTRHKQVTMVQYLINNSREYCVIYEYVGWIEGCSSFFFAHKAKNVFDTWRCKTISDLMINEQIRDKEVRVIGADGEMIGIMSSKEAQALAREAELDLVKISPNAKPPVCKIIDYGKYRYEQARKEKEAKKKQKTIEIKEIRLSPNIEENDLNTKVANARKFLTKGDRVKVTLRFRGREMAHVQSSKQILDVFAEKLADVATVEKAPKLEGRSMSMFLTEKR